MPQKKSGKSKFRKSIEDSQHMREYNRRDKQRNESSNNRKDREASKYIQRKRKRVGSD